MASKFKVKQLLYSNDEYAHVSSSGVKISAKKMEQCSQLTTAPGILAVVQAPDNQPTTFGKINLILDNISDPGNMGTIIRSASWFGVDRLILTSDCVDIYNAKVVQSTMGGLFHLPITRAPKSEILEALNNWEGSLLIADMDGQSSREYDWPQSLALVIGSESQGVSQEFREASTSVVSIDKRGKGESLNAAVSASILLAQMFS